MSGHVSAVLTAVDPEARWRLGVVAKRTYLVEHQRVVPAPSQLPLTAGPVLAEEGVTLQADTDLMLRRGQVDVILTGHVYPHDSATSTTLDLKVGALERRIRVFGDRRIERHGRLVRITSPQRFERIPLGWESAYGGVDRAALAAYGDPTEALRREAGLEPDPRFGLYAYPRNPAGRGYLVELSDEAIERTVLPNLEDPLALLTPETLVYGNSLAWPGGPPPASTAWFPHSFFPRCTLLGFPPPMWDEERFPPSTFHEVRMSLIAPRALEPTTHVATLHDLRGAQSSAPGMRALTIEPGNVVRIQHVHPRKAQWQFTLDVKPPKLYYRLPGGTPTQLKGSIRTVLLEPDVDRVVLVWVAETPMNTPLPPEKLAQVEHAAVWG